MTVAGLRLRVELSTLNPKRHKVGFVEFGECLHRLAPESNIRIAVLKKPSMPRAAQSRSNGAAFDRLFAFHHQPVDRKLSPCCEESADETPAKSGQARSDGNRL